MAEIVKMQVFYAEQLAPAGESSTNGIRRAGEDPLVPLRHCFDESGSFWRKIAPSVISQLVARVLYIADQHALLVVVLPFDGDDFLLAPRAKDRERNDPLHRDRIRASRFYDAEVIH